MCKVPALLRHFYSDLTLPTHYPVSKELLSAFSSAEGANELTAYLLPRPSTGSLEHIFCGAYSYLDSLHDAGIVNEHFTNNCPEFYVRDLSVL
jgi:hypothetical protein